MVDLLFGAAFAAVGVGVFLQTRGFPTLRDGHPGPALFPGILALALTVAGLALVVYGVARPRRLAAEFRAFSLPGPGLLRVVVVVLLGLLYPLLHAQVGFVPTASALIFGVAIILRARPLPAAVVTAASTWIIYLAFTRLLGVPL
jgi:putative tricarboxylic transport membrane protein